VQRDLGSEVLKVGARERGDRYQTAAELAAVRGRFLADRPVRARRVSWVEQARRWGRRNRAVALLTAGVILSLTSAVVVLALKNVEIRQQRDETDRALKSASDNYTEAKIQEGLAKENEKRASDNAKLADAQKLLAGRRFHNAQIYLANLAVEAGDTPRALSLLETLRPKPDEDDFRTFEWYYLWQRCNHSHRLTCRGHERPVACVQVSPDGKTIASSSADGTVRLWNLTTGKQSTILRRSSYWYTCVAFSPNGRLLACGSFDVATLRLWDLETGRELAFSGQYGGVRSVAFSPDGATLACGYESGCIRFWDPMTGQELTGPPGQHTAPVVALAFSPDGKTLATASGWGDTLTKLWDLSVSPIRQRLELPGTLAVAFSPDGTKVVTGAGPLRQTVSPDGTTVLPGGLLKPNTVLWDAGTGQKLTEFD